MRPETTLVVPELLLLLELVLLPELPAELPLLELLLAELLLVGQE